MVNKVEYFARSKYNLKVQIAYQGELIEELTSINAGYQSVNTVHKVTEKVQTDVH